MGPEGEPYAVVHSISQGPYSLKQAVGPREGTEQSGANRSLLVQDITHEFITSNSLPIIITVYLGWERLDGSYGICPFLLFKKAQDTPCLGMKHGGALRFAG
jgi:hypothetical protein